ncbi:LPS export ABC transporter permease LptF [Mesorhizobium sp. NBSH29]|uniref:LPS export ABC transporter permease LptF n=1 Tax=Mesorhizobium sp. NBSH29 TaxID=2654249 RepID=UPI0018968CE6|nr:LPS export ABC transporter permease LptF [Mesorhizobium sp. NBSH29]QPC87326.1 LPS export ABC transporter permease LptF [Mesorhizobium sp. NBSH29]
MKVVERYILRRAFVVFAAALFWTLAIVWTTQVLTRIDFVTSSGQSALAFFELATLVLPSVIPVVIPFAVAIAVAQTLSMMNGDSELVVISAAGSSRLATIRPILLLAAGASMLSFVVDNGIDPFARQRARELVSTARADLLSTVVQEGSFRKIDEGLFVQIAERLPDGKLGGIFVADSREKNVDLVYYARDGAVIDMDAKNVLLMSDGVVHRKTVGASVSVIKFNSYAFDLSAFSSAASQIVLFAKDRTLGSLFNPDPNDPVYMKAPQQFRAELHRRLTEWVYPLVFALIALAVAGDARSHRQARIHPIVTALSFALIVRWLGFFVANEAQTAPAFAVAVYLVPIMASAISIWFILTLRSMELPVTWADNAAAFVRRIGDRIILVRHRLLGHPVPDVKGHS